MQIRSRGDRIGPTVREWDDPWTESPREATLRPIPWKSPSGTLPSH